MDNAYHPRAALVVTLKNEAASIGVLLQSILDQTLPPEEVIISDGGSTDGTLEQLRAFASKHPFMRVLEVPGANRSRGRNEAIRSTRCNIIASTDAECRLHPDWLKHLVEPFKGPDPPDAVGSWFQPILETTWDRCLALATIKPLSRVKPASFLPTARSMAFTKEAWLKVGGFPESQPLSEDRLFVVDLKKSGCCFAFAPEATLYWRQRQDIQSVIAQYFMYGQGLGEELVFGTEFIYSSAEFLLGFALLATGFFFWPLWVLLLAGFVAFCTLHMAKGRGETFRHKALIAALHILSRLANLAGRIYGVWRRLFVLRKARSV